MKFRQNNSKFCQEIWFSIGKQCDQTFKILVGNFITTVAKLFDDFLGYFESIIFQAKTLVVTLGLLNTFGLFLIPTSRI